jgi:hypothetical protein
MVLRFFVLRARWRLGFVFFAFRFALWTFLLWRRRRTRHAVMRV